MVCADMESRLTWRRSCMTMMVTVFVVVSAPVRAQPARAQLPDYNCSATITEKLSLSVRDPCGNTTAYSQLGSCADFMAGNRTTPSASCCENAHGVWASYPACFCKVTFFSKFPGDGPTLARARPALCNITDDLCEICPQSLSGYQSENGGEHTRKINTASVVTISVIVTLAIVGLGGLLYWCKRRAVWKKKQGQSETYVPQFNNV